MDWFKAREEGEVCQKCRINEWIGDLEPGEIEQELKEAIGGRPKLTPTEVITLRIPTPVMDIIKRRAADAHMSPRIWLVERVIRNEVVRKHRKLEDRKISDEGKIERGA